MFLGENEMMGEKNLKSEHGYKRTFINDDISPLHARLLGHVKKLSYMGWNVDGKNNAHQEISSGTVSSRSSKTNSNRYPR